jgi:thioredoxin reductase
MGLSYIALEQEQIVNTIQKYPAGKYVFFKPDGPTSGGIRLNDLEGGDLKETTIDDWMQTVKELGLVINEYESCKEIKAENNLFVLTTEAGKTNQTNTYRVRKVILGIGNSGDPMRLGVEGEEIRIPGVDGKPLAKVFYRLIDPNRFQGKKIIVVGAGNSAVEAAVDLVGERQEDGTVKFTRNNEVTLIIRSDFKSDLKLGNKMQIYYAIDHGRITTFFRCAIKEIRENEVVIMDVRTKKEVACLPNDHVFALIGGKKPTDFLKALGIKVGKDK